MFETEEIEKCIDFMRQILTSEDNLPENMWVFERGDENHDLSELN